MTRRSTHRGSDSRPSILAVPLDNLSVAAAVDLLTRPIDPPRIVHFVHAHTLRLADADGELRGRLQAADVVFADGVGMRMGAAILGFRLRANLNGTDLLPLICTAAAAQQIPLVLIGSRSDIVDRCAANLLRDHPNLVIPFFSHGYLDDAGAREVADRVIGVGRCIVLVGMGSPTQEAFAWTALADAPDATVITVGGLFDFFSRDTPRAPSLMREWGLEWVFRLYGDPKRLWRRYLIGNPDYLLRVVRERVGI
jgi:N-acetylglucosaminyldiphosphoundecaprenol N-acetyl-beta-D-mannosaminyltransferase